MKQAQANCCLVAVGMLLMLGCSVPRLASRDAEAASKFAVAEKKAKAAAAQSTASQSTAPQSNAASGGGSALAEDRAGAASARKGTTGGTNKATPDAQQMAEVLAQLQAAGAVSPEVQQRLSEDLKATDPALWPQLLQSFQATLAYRQQLAAKDRAAAATDAGVAAEPSIAGVPAVPGESASATAKPRLSPPSPSSIHTPVQPASHTAPLSQPASKGQATTPMSAPASPSPTGSSPTGSSPSGSSSAAQRTLPGFDEASAPAAAAGVSPITAGYASTGGAPPASMLPISLPLPGAETAGAHAALASLQTAPRTLPMLDNAQLISDQHLGHAGSPPRLAPGSTSGLSSPAAAVAVHIAAAQAQQAALATPASYNAPVAQAPRSWPEHLNQAIMALERETSHPPTNPDETLRHVHLRMLQLAAGRRDDALRPIAGLPPAQQDFWKKELYGLATYLDSSRITDPSRRASEAASHLQAAAARLAETGQLVVRNLAFCSEVTSFGVYKRFDKQQFKPDQAVILYAEVDNFKSESTEKGYHTALKSSYQILDAQGSRVAEQEFPATEEYCQNARRDFFIRFVLRMPHRLYDGNYTLQLTIEDTKSQKIAQSSIQFAVKEVGP